MNHTEVINAADSMIAATRELIDNLHPPTTSPGRLRVTLFLTIAEQFEACVQLLRVHMTSHAAVHTRSMLEALVSMNLLGQREDYVEQMLYKQLKGKKKLLENLVQNEYLPDESKPLIQSMLLESIPAFDEKHKAGIRSKQIGDEMLEAGLAELIPPYLMLCGFSHNDIGVLALRHQGDDVMTYMAPVHDEITVSIFMTAIKILVQAAEPLPRIALFPEGIFEIGFQKMNNLWGEALDACDA
jgi:hypothetical protein